MAECRYWELLLLCLLSNCLASRSECYVDVELVRQDPPSLVSGRASGILDGFAEGLTPEKAVRDIHLHTMRNPSRGLLPWKCNADSCPPPFVEIPKLRQLGVKNFQIILGPQMLEVVCKAKGRNYSTECPLPGFPGDVNMTFWLSAVDFALSEAKRMNKTDDIVFDIWNEPNFFGHPGTGGGGYSHNYSLFFQVWHITHRLIKKELPKARIVGPSAAPNPLPHGWSGQKKFLQSFLLACKRESTLPDLLSWHDYSGSVFMLKEMTNEMKSWMIKSRITPMPRIGFNEHTAQSVFMSPGYSAAMLSNLEQLDVDHAVKGCWNEPLQPQVSSCFDGSLDGLLNMTVGGLPRPIYWTYKWYASLVQKPKLNVQVRKTTRTSKSCSELHGLATLHSRGTLSSTTIQLLLGRANVTASESMSLLLNVSSASPSQGCKWNVLAQCALGGTVSKQSANSSPLIIFNGTLDGSVVELHNILPNSSLFATFVCT